MQTVCHKQSICIPEKLLPWSNQLMAELHIDLNVGWSTSFHCMNSNLFSGSQWKIHNVYPVTKRRQNSSLSLVYKLSSSWDEATHWQRSCALRFWETQRADTWKLWGIVCLTLTVEMCNSCNCRRHYSSVFKTKFSDNWFVASEGWPEHG